ncbi:thioredoxin family protein [Flavobacterium sp. FlaQc-30]|uniref:thioredoxin family protein n=1 Tax=Flavobacterium sp. FlaQc-30 TaxID=3374179 RepID=UPI0037575D2A
MKIFLKLTSAFLFFSFFSNCLNAQTQSSDQTWDQIKNQAVASNKLIFVDLYFKGCMPCAQMEKEVFPDPKVAAFLENNFVTLKTDVLKEEIGKKLCMKYAVTGYPTFLFMNAEGKIIDIAAGFQSVDQFIELLQNAKENAQKGIFKKYSTQIDEKDYPEFYLKALAEKKLPPFETVDSYLKKQTSLFEEIPFTIIIGLRAGNQYDEFFIKNLDVFSKDYGRSSVHNHILNILRRKKKEFEKTNNIEDFKKLMNKVKPIYTTEEWTKYENALLKDFDTSKAQNEEAVKE